MKKKYLAILMAAVLVAMAAVGCGSSNDKKAKESDKKTTQSTEKKDKKNDEKTSEDTSQDAGQVVESPDALNVAEDTFQMADLVTKVGGTEADLLAMLGASEAAEVYNTKLFGADVAINVTSNEGTVQGITLTFASVAKDSLVNAISEQLGADGEEADDKTSWSYEDRNIVLTAGDQNNVVEISQ